MCHKVRTLPNRDVNEAIPELEYRSPVLGAASRSRILFQWMMTRHSVAHHDLGTFLMNMVVLPHDCEGSLIVSRLLLFTFMGRCTNILSVTIDINSFEIHSLEFAIMLVVAPNTGEQ